MSLSALVVAMVLSTQEAAVAPATPSPQPPSPQRLAEQVWLIPGGFPAGREPDGNTVVFGVGDGLAVFDTGRHLWHGQAISDFIAADGRPLAAIVNSHWHLDHTSGNLELKPANPGATVFASRAVDGAIEGFMRPSVAAGRDYIASGQAPATMIEDVTRDIAVIEQAESLKPDVYVEADGPLPVGDRSVQLRVAAHAATDADLWLWHPASGVAAVGDLITLPVPFLDTACPRQWREALDAVWATPFTLAVPGHGRPLNRAEFDVYRQAFGALNDCIGTDREPRACAADWAGAITGLVETDRERRLAVSMTAGYVESLRQTGGASRHCKA